MGKKTKRPLALLMAAAMVLSGNVSAYADDLAKGMDERTLADCNNIAYLVQAGTETPQVAAPGYNTGYYQSCVDQGFGEDPVTKKKWGYVENEYIVYGASGDGSTGITNTKRYLSPTDSSDNEYFVKGETGIKYAFEIPDGTYNVTVGFYNNWDERPVDIVIEGNNVATGLTLKKNSEVKKTSSVTVSDGYLDVFVHNPNRKDQYQDALLSYILVEVPVNSKVEEVELTLKKCTAGEEGLYSPSSYEKYIEAYNNLKSLLNDESKLTDERVKSYSDKLSYHFSRLEQKGTPVTYTSFTGTNGVKWLDTDGTEIQAHGGQVQKFTYNGETKWYWYGEDKTDGYRTVGGGVRVYSSADLYNWKNEGVALRNLTDMYDFEEDYFASLYGDLSEAEKKSVLLAINDTTSVIERPKVIYNAKTNKYVMWFHADGPTETSNSNYAAASAGVAVSDSPTGPFKFLRRSRMNYVNGAHDSSKGMARDMNLFVDDDCTAYIIYSSEENQTMIISKLNDDYTALAEDADVAAGKYDRNEAVLFSRIPIYIRKAREAPAMFKYNGRYYLMTSACTGWGANAADYAVSDSVLGSWTSCGNPCISDTDICSYGANLTFGTQSTNIFEYEAGKYIYMGDRWNASSPAANELVAPTYVWLPVELDGDGNMTLNPRANWNLSVMASLAPVSIKTELPVAVKKNGLDSLPKILSIKTADGVTKDYPVSWKVSKGDINEAGKFVTVSGTISELGNKVITKEFFVYSEDFVYFVDSASNLAEGYQPTLYNFVKFKVPAILNESGDKEYKGDAKWGYVAGSYDGFKGTESGLGINGTGFYGKNDGSSNTTYKVTLDKGAYKLVTESYEWWTGPRSTEVVVSYKDGGKTVSTNLGNVTIQGSGATGFITGEFDVKSDNTVVTVEFRRGSTGDAGVVTYFTIEKDTSDYSGTFTYDSSLLPSFVTGIESMPSTMNVKYGDTEINSAVLWEITSTDNYIGREVTLKGKALKGGGVITHKARLYSDTLEYFFECGSHNAVYEALKKVVTLKNITEDAGFTDSLGYGYTVAGSAKGSVSGVDDLFSSGRYGENDGSKNVTYKVTLNKGDYEITSGHYEWWGNDSDTRKTDVIVEIDGTKKTLATVSVKKSSRIGMQKSAFSVEKDNSVVTIIFGKNSSGKDAGAVAYFAIDNVTSPEHERTMLTINPDKASTFNDGKFEGWGTSFCWWANRVGYSDTLSNKAGDYFYGEDGLHMDIVRYNIGGGDNPTHNHIKRTDSEMPGYWVNPEVIVDGKTIVAATAPKNEENRVTVKSGNAVYSWAYDWTKDSDQRNVLLKAKEAYGDDLIVEAFSNSPPYFMTYSLCSSGNTNANDDNLRKDAYTAFAKYMADVAAHFRDAWGITFQSITPMNEPYTNYWSANSDKQEGCHFDQGASESDIIVALHDAMVENGFEDGSIIYSANDETSVDTQITSYKKLSADAKKIVTRIDSHTYSGSNYSGLRDLAETYNQNLWMSEVDGSGTKGVNAGEMGAGLYFADLIMRDMNGLLPSAWIMWQVIDNHASSEGRNGKKDSGMVNLNGGYWGCAVADHDNTDIILTKKYYSFGQFTRYIRPGYTIIGGTGNTLCALDTENNRLVIVAANYSDEEAYIDFDLSLFTAVGENVKAIRTSNTENWAELPSSKTHGDGFFADLKGNSITTYIVDDVTMEGISLSEIELSASMVTGSDPWNNGSDRCEKAVDGNLSSFFDGLTNGYLTIDLGEEYNIDGFAYAPRSGYLSRAIGAVLYGSNNGTDWTRIYEITTSPSEGINLVTKRAFENKNAYRYIMYKNDVDCANIAEIKLYGTPVNAASGDDTYVTRVVDVEKFGATFVNEVPANLPATVQAKLKNNTFTTLDIEWNEMSSSDFAVPYSRVQVNGKAVCPVKGTEFPVHTFVTVVPKDILYFIDCGSKDDGSRAFDGVSEIADLKNRVSDREFAEGAGFGFAGIDGSYTGNDDAMLYARGHYGFNKSATPVVYTLPLSKGTYNVVMYVHNWWGARSMSVTYDYKNGNKTVEGTVKSNYRVNGHSENEYQTIEINDLKLPADTVLHLNFTADNGNDGAIINFIAVSGKEEKKEETPSKPYTPSRPSTNDVSLASAGNSTGTVTASVTEAPVARISTVRVTPLAVTEVVPEDKEPEVIKEEKTVTEETVIEEESVPSVDKNEEVKENEAVLFSTATGKKSGLTGILLVGLGVLALAGLAVFFVKTRKENE